MPVIKLTAFQGEQPRIEPRLLPDSAAQAAINVKLDDGALTPFRVPVQIAQAEAANDKTIYRHGETWLSWPGVVHATPGAVASDRLYYTGDGAPKVRVGDTVYPLAVPRPVGALTAAVGGSGSGDVVTRTYVYTYVTAFGEESEPSPASAPEDWQPGQTVTLSGFEAVPTGRAIEKQRIYRSQTGQSGTWLYLIAERTAETGNFVDTVAVDQFAEPLPSTDWNAPPDGLSGLIALPNGMMAGFVGRDLYFCEPYRPHAWPEKYMLTTDYDIVGLGAVGMSLIIMTKGQPYLASGTLPENMQMVKIEQNLPCINARGIVDMGYAICYPTHEGLVAARADGSIGIVSGPLFSPEAWERYGPSRFVASQHQGRYVAFFDTFDLSASRVAGALILDIGQAPFLIRTSAFATAVFHDIEAGALCYMPPGATDIFRLDAPSGPRHEMYWRSKPFYLPTPMNFGAILVDAEATLSGEEVMRMEAAIADIVVLNADLLSAGSVKGELGGTPVNAVTFGGDILHQIPRAEGTLQVGVYADGKRVAQIDRTNMPIRLPSGFKARVWEIDVAGDLKVTQIAMANSVVELQQTV